MEIMPSGPYGVYVVLPVEQVLRYVAEVARLLHPEKEETIAKESTQKFGLAVTSTALMVRNVMQLSMAKEACELFLSGWFNAC